MQSHCRNTTTIIGEKERGAFSNWLQGAPRRRIAKVTDQQPDERIDVIDSEEGKDQHYAKERKSGSKTKIKTKTKTQSEARTETITTDQRLKKERQREKEREREIERD